MTHDELRDRLSRIEEFNRVKWLEHDKRSEDNWGEVKEHLREGREMFGSIQKELAERPCTLHLQKLKDHSERISNFQVSVHDEVKQSERRVKFWVLAGLLTGLFSLVVAGCGAVMSGVLQRFF